MNISINEITGNYNTIEGALVVFSSKNEEGYEFRSPVAQLGCSSLPPGP